MENSLFGLAAYERTGEAVVRGSENEATGEAVDEEPAEISPDPLIDSGLAQAKSLEQHSDLLIRLSLYEHRLNRTLEKTKAELKQLQQERAKSREKALEQAADIAKFKERLCQPWDPHENGFEFSAEDLTVWMRRVKLINQADLYVRAGVLPVQPAPSDEKEHRTAPRASKGHKEC
jgi:hypothetical protein